MNGATSHRRGLIVAAAVYLVVGVLAYLRVIDAGFAGDDWQFLRVIAPAPNAMVSFHPFNGFTRPIVAFVYYLNYHGWGLWTVPAHVFAVLLNGCNAWLVTLLVLRLAPRDDRWIAYASGLLFLLFAGHSEAVSWVAGLADQTIVPFLVGSLLLFDRALTAERPGRWMVGAWVVGMAGLLAKETAVLLPALAFVFGALRAGVPLRTQIIRTTAFTTAAVLVPIVFLGLRVYRFGSVLGTYGTITSTRAQLPDSIRMFLLRAFLPPGRLAAFLWTHHLDLGMFAIALAAVVLVAWRRPETRSPLSILAAATLVSLAPAFPLSISLVNTLSERYVYLATAFALPLFAWTIAGTLRSRAAGIAVIGVLVLFNWRHLDYVNHEWAYGPRLFRQIADDLLPAAQEAAKSGTASVLLLNVPDALHRPFIDTAGIGPALALMDRTLPMQGIVQIATVHETETAGPVAVRQDGEIFHLDVGADHLVEDWKDGYTVHHTGAHQADVFVPPARRRTIVALTSEGRVRRVADLNGSPFGYVDLPAADGICTGESLRFAGWALDDEGVERVEIVPGGVAAWRTGTRPDVEQGFTSYPNTRRAEWEFAFPCRLASAAKRPLRVRVTATDAGGRQTELGVRTIIAGGS